MKFGSINIVKSFLKRAFLSILTLSIIAITIVYFIEKDRVANKLAIDISNHVDQVLKSSEKDIQLIDNFFIEHIKMIDFNLFKLYDKNRKEIFSFSKNIKNHKLTTILKIPYSLNENDISYKFVEILKDQYYLIVSYPIFKDNKLLGFIEGAKRIDKKIIEAFRNQVIYAILSVISVIVLFSLVIFPLIYIAYKKLDTHKKELLTNNIMTINTLGNTIALRDSDTSEHNYRVTIYAIRLAQEVGLEKNLVEKLIIGSFLHDIGKIGITDNILLKNGKLTEEEFDVIKTHVQKGVDIIAGNKWLELGKDVILYHHEKYDGTGYPAQIVGDNIPKIARIFAIVDVFDAITSKRPYKEPYSYQKTIDIMNKSTKIHFDPKILKLFIKISKKLYDETSLKSAEKLKDEVNFLISNCFLEEECILMFK